MEAKNLSISDSKPINTNKSNLSNFAFVTKYFSF